MSLEGQYLLEPETVKRMVQWAASRDNDSWKIVFCEPCGKIVKCPVQMCEGCKGDKAEESR